jgi:hypothetical protein
MHSDVSSVLHLCHKLEYFKNARWSDKWCMSAYQIVHDMFKASYKGHWHSKGPSILDTRVSLIIIHCNSHSCDYVLSQPLEKSALKNIFNELLALAVPKPSDICDKLEHYLSTDPEYVLDSIS